MDDLTDKELNELIAGLTLTNDEPNRVIICQLLIELRDLRRRWKALEGFHPALAETMTRLSRGH